MFPPIRAPIFEVVTGGNNTLHDVCPKDEKTPDEGNRNDPRLPEFGVSLRLTHRAKQLMSTTRTSRLASATIANIAAGAGLTIHHDATAPVAGRLSGFIGAI